MLSQKFARRRSQPLRQLPIRAHHHTHHHNRTRFSPIAGHLNRAATPWCDAVARAPPTRRARPWSGGDAPLARCPLAVSYRAGAPLERVAAAAGGSEVLAECHPTLALTARARRSGGRPRLPAPLGGRRSRQQLAGRRRLRTRTARGRGRRARGSIRLIAGCPATARMGPSRGLRPRMTMKSPVSESSG